MKFLIGQNNLSFCLYSSIFCSICQVFFSKAGIAFSLYIVFLFISVYPKFYVDK